MTACGLPMLTQVISQSRPSTRSGARTTAPPSAVAGSVVGHALPRQNWLTHVHAHLPILQQRRLYEPCRQVFGTGSHAQI